jgi:RNA polymerase sigma factor (sigma-70 family)
MASMPVLPAQPAAVRSRRREHASGSRRRLVHVGHRPTVCLHAGRAEVQARHEHSWTDHRRRGRWERRRAGGPTRRSPADHVTGRSGVSRVFRISENGATVTGPGPRVEESMVDGRTTAELVEAAGGGDETAWAELVHRHAGLVMAICRRMRLTDADARDVSQTVWLRLVEHLVSLREPSALPGWLAQTARHESLRVLRRSASAVPLDDWDQLPAEGDVLDAELLAAERRSALREAFASLPPASRDLLALLIADPPIPYREVSRRLGIPVGSIGPTRARILDRLRQAPALAALLDDLGDPAPPPPRTSGGIGARGA